MSLHLNSANLWSRIYNLKPDSIAPKKPIQSLLMISLAMITHYHFGIVYVSSWHPFGFAALSSCLQMVMCHILALDHHFSFCQSYCYECLGWQW